MKKAFFFLLPAAALAAGCASSSAALRRELADTGPSGAIVSSTRLADRPQLAAARERALKLLSAAELDDAALRELGADAADAVFWCYQDSNLSPIVRSRALHAMGRLGDATSRARLLDIVETGKVEAIYGQAALVGLAECGGDTVPHILPKLDAIAPELRLGAVEAASRVGTPECREALERRLSDERDSRVRGAIERALMGIASR